MELCHRFECGVCAGLISIGGGYANFIVLGIVIGYGSGYVSVLLSSFAIRHNNPSITKAASTAPSIISVTVSGSMEHLLAQVYNHAYEACVSFLLSIYCVLHILHFPGNQMLMLLYV